MSRADAVQALFARALGAEAAERARLLAAEPDEDVRAECEELLRCAEREEHPLDAWTVEPDRLRSALEASLGPWPDPPPEKVGPYAIRGLLGAGSMSTVFLGERAHPRGDVAVKVLKPWLAGGEALRRFELEVELLSRLDHPRIARILDAGRADFGAAPHPYLVLEFVRGRPLDAWVEAERPPRRERLRLFNAVCAGVAHAHQKGVVHRDLKPSNVLVDERGEPHLVDFGVARAAGEDLRAASLLTSMGQIVGTLEYMSPEQAAGRSDEIDTRADVYALGVLLQELLTGRRPIEFEGRPLPECLRRIAEEEPAPLGQVDRTLAGDLETIVRKALEKDRARRYATVQELAGDVERFLANEPITARPPSSIYLARKYVRRHPAVAAAAGVGALALVATAVGVSLGWREARAQGRLAEERLAAAEAAREESDRVAAVLAGVIRAPQASAQGRDVLLRDVVLELGDDIREHLPDHPRGRGQLGFFVAQSLSTLGEPTRALERVEASLADMEKAGMLREPIGYDARRLRASLLGQMGRAAESRDAVKELLAEGEPRYGAEDERVLGLLLDLGTALVNVPDLAAAENVFEDALAKHARVFGGADPRTLQAKVAFAGLRLSQGRFDAVIAELSDAWPLLRAAHADEPHRMKTAIGHLSEALTATGELERALALRREQVEICEAAFGPDQYHTWDARMDLAGTLMTLGRFGEVQELSSAVLEWARANLDASHPMVIGSLSSLGSCHLIYDRFEESEASYREAIKLAELHYPSGDLRITTLRLRTAEVAIYQAKGAEAKALLEPLMAELDPRDPAQRSTFFRVRNCLGKAHLILGETDRGVELIEAAVADRVEAEGMASPYSVIGALDASDSFGRSGLYPEALAILGPFEEPLAELAKTSAVHLELATAMALQRGLIHVRAEEPAEAKAALARAEELAAGLEQPIADDVEDAFQLLRTGLEEARAHR